MQKRMKNQHKRNLRNVRNKDFLSRGSKHIRGWSTKKMEIICSVKFAQTRANRTE